MDLDELDEHTKLHPPLVIKPYTSSNGYGDYMKRRIEQDKQLKLLKCPDCGSDIKYAVRFNCHYYDCMKDKTHTFIRTTSLITEEPVTDVWGDGYD